MDYRKDEEDIREGQENQNAFKLNRCLDSNYGDVIMTVMAYQTTCVSTVCSVVC